MMTLRTARLVQVLGILVALLGLLGYWFNRDVQRTTLTAEERERFGVDERTDVISFVVAGRDREPVRDAGALRYVNGRCERTRPGEFVTSKRTDTVLYVAIVGEEIRIISFLRDIYLPQYGTRLNTIYGRHGADGLRQAVSDIVHLPVDYYAIVNIEIFQKLVDAMGGVEVHVPYDMVYQDCADGLNIDLREGLTFLNGEDAAGFVRFRHTSRGDYDRVDNVKRLAFAMLRQLKDLNVRALGTVPGLVKIALEEIETNASPALVASLLPRLGNMNISHAVSLPTCCERRVEGVGVVVGFEPAVVDTFLAEAFGGTAAETLSAPDEPLLITNRSGLTGLAELMKERLVALGVPEERLITREESVDPSVSRLMVLSSTWHDADYYTHLLHVAKQQIDHLPTLARQPFRMELVLAQDAAQLPFAQNLRPAATGLTTAHP
jgi:LCP family protein required for cell wall assembly